MFTSSIKRRIRKFHFVVVQGRQRNVQKSLLHAQSCSAADQTVLVAAIVQLKLPIVLTCSRRSYSGEGTVQNKVKSSQFCANLHYQKALGHVLRSTSFPGLFPYKMGGEKIWRRGCPEMRSSGLRVSPNFPLFLVMCPRTF